MAILFDMLLNVLLTVFPILILLISLILSIRRHSDPERTCTWLLAIYVLMVGGLCLCQGSGDLPEKLTGMLKIVFQVLQGDSEAFLLLTPVDSEYRVLALILSILTPVMTAGAVFSLLCRRLPWPVLLPRKCHIFSTLDDHAVMLAQSIAREEKARFIFLRTRREDLTADLLLQLQSLRFSCYPYGEVQLFRHHLSLRLRPLCMYFLTENSEENFDRMAEFLDQAQKKRLFLGMEKPEHRQLFLLSETTSSPMLIDYLRKTYALPGTELRLLDRYRAASLHLMKTAPLYEARRDGPVRVLMLGMGQVGRSLFRTMASMGVIGKHAPEFHLVDQNINNILANMKQLYPELVKNLAVTPNRRDAQSSTLNGLLEKNSFDYIVVALGEDERNLRVASALDRYYRKEYWAGKRSVLPRLCVNLEDETKAQSTRRIYPSEGLNPWEPGFTVFGTDQEVFSGEVLLPRELWLAARKLHTLLNGNAPEQDWCEYERRSSIASVAHGAAHVASVLPTGQNDLFAYDYSTLSEKDLQTLKAAEHLRWMNYVRSEGMCMAEDPIWGKYLPLLHSHVDIRGQLTPCLCDSKQLDTLHDNLKDRLTGRKYSFTQQDELVVRNADLFARHWIKKKTDSQLRELPKQSP